eukprot:9605076-Ditylum_brightwellii.AAC.1
MYSGFKLKFTVGAATKGIPYTIGVALDLLESIWEQNLLPIPKFHFFPLPSLEFLTVAYVAKAFELEKNSHLRNLYT